MLVIDSVRRFKKQELKDMVRKQANIKGSDENIKLVCQSRWATGFQPTPPDLGNLEIRVQYLVGENDGFVHIQSLAIRCAKKWDTFFDRAQGRIGEVTIDGRKYRFLLEDSLQEYLTLLSGYEMSDREETGPVLRRLTSAGPDAFPTTSHLSE
jgi:hypothetical protein